MSELNEQHLLEKWAPLLNFDGLDPIKDSHRRKVTAILLENQEKELRETNAFNNGLLMETTLGNAPGASGGFSGSAAAGGPVAGLTQSLSA